MKNTILQDFRKIVSSKLILKVTQAVKFNQRCTAQISGLEFVQMLVSQVSSGHALTYSNLNASLSKINSQISLSNQALAKYFYKESSVCLVKSIYESVFSFQKNALLSFNLKKIDHKTIDIFERILIQDSTVCVLDKRLASKYKGSGGSSSESSLKIDVIQELKTSAVIKINIIQGSENDVLSSSLLLEELMSEDLILRDLGYFKADEFQKICDKNAFFISRYKSTINVYMNEKDHIPVELGNLLKNHYDKFPSQIFDKPVFLGSKKLKVRIVAYKVPLEVANERRRKANRASACNGVTPSKARLNLCDFVILITNIDPELITPEVIGTIYRIRWTIELIFKTWKSYFNLQKSLNGYRETRIECFIYATLIVCLLTSLVHGWLKKSLDPMGKEISQNKLARWMVNRRACYELLFGTIPILQDRISRDLRELKMQKRKRKTTLERVVCSESYGEKFAVNF